MSDLNLKKFLGYRFFKEIDTENYEVIRVIEINQKDNSRCTVVNEDTGEKLKVGTDFLRNYTPLEPFGMIFFNIVKLSNKEGDRANKDILITAYRLIDVRLGLNNYDPYIICRQSATDFFYNLIAKDPTDHQLVGFSVTKETCPTNIQMKTLTACSDVYESEMIHIYKDDTIDSILNCIDKSLLYNINYTLNKLYEDHCKAINATPMEKTRRVLHGWCKDLKLLLETNNFMVDFNQMCDITGVDTNLLEWMSDNEDGTYSLNRPALLFLSTVFKVHAIDSRVIKFDYTINMANFKNDKYVMLRDNTNTIWIVVYLEEGEYLEQDLINEINELDVTTKLALSYFNKYANV